MTDRQPTAVDDERLRRPCCVRPFAPWRPVFVPLGRMALTNYLSATVLVQVASLVIGPASAWPMTTVLSIAGGILGLQWVWSSLWLARFTQGPPEWLWRWVTWAGRPALRRR